MGLIRFFKKWTLPCSMAVGACVYLLFSKVDFLIPIGDTAGPFFIEIMPFLIFAMLYVTFCKIRLHDLRLSAWHGWLQAIRVALAGLLILAMTHTGGATKLILEGMFVCVMCPTAAAAAVITDKLGGSIASMTVYTLIDNGLTAILIPLFFPLVEKEADITFATSFLIILEKVATVLILPFCCAMATRKWLPKVAEKIKSVKNLAFYMWGFNLSIVMGLTMHNILTARLDGMTMALLLLLPLAVTFILFGIGKAVGKRYDDSVSGGQALGQKNTIVGIWLTITYLNPTAAIAPCAYVIWQNSVNSWQLWCKEKYGKLKW
ncbi:MAG TPA: transporter [Candidatus Phocaeicola excrementigallinarum]|nr:transporter [Candidatus Phocaeicola excrementigallinarum]